MNFKVTKLIEFEDGSAELNVEMDEETKRYLINHAFIDLLTAGLEETKKLWEKNHEANEK